MLRDVVRLGRGERDVLRRGRQAVPKERQERAVERCGSFFRECVSSAGKKDKRTLLKVRHHGLTDGGWDQPIRAAPHDKCR